MRSLLTATALATLIRNSAHAQENVDITLLDGGDRSLEVRLRSAQDPGRIPSSIVFTLRWRSESDITLLDPVPVAGMDAGVHRCGQPYHADPFTYQVFSGIAFTPLHDTAMGPEYAFLTIPFRGNGAVELVNDERTSELNGDYYVSFGGEDRTGTIYGTFKRDPVESPAALLVSIWPVPTNGICNYSIITSMTGPIMLELRNTTGQLVLVERAQVNNESVKGVLDLGSLPAGPYSLSIAGDPAGGRYTIIRE